MPPVWRDLRHPMEIEADARIAAGRGGAIAGPAIVPAVQLEPWPLKGTDAGEPTPEITRAISDATDRLTAERVVRGAVREKRMSLLGKMRHLTDSAQDFHKETEAVLDGIAEKIATGRTKRDEAAAKHHAYYDAIISGVDESTAVIDRLSNGPLSGDGEN